MTSTEVRIASIAFLAVALLSVFAPLALAYEENIREGIFLVRPENEYIPETGVPIYLNNEDLIFFACLEQDNVPIRLSVLCTDTNEFEDLEARKWGPQNCYVGSTNLEKFDCSQAVVQADYVSAGENLKLSQRIRINKFSNTLNRIIETQFTDGGWETPLDTAYGLFVISHFPEIFRERVSRAVEYLKLNRNEEEKCWPAEQCRISTTANILFLLEKAGFEDLRIQHDGRLYLEVTQNYITGQQWEVRIRDHLLNVNNTIDTSCVYDYDGDIETFALERYPASRTETFLPAYGNTVSVVCTENVFVDIYNEYGENLISYQGDNFTHTIPDACWTRNNENIQCDLRSTLLAASSPLDNAQLGSTKSYLSSLEIADRTAGKHLTEDWNLINDALYLHLRIGSTQDFLTSLLYQQLNEGGWHLDETYYEHSHFEVSDRELAALEAEITDNVSRDIVTTGYVVMGLLENGYDREDEPILDAERWVSLMEDETGLNFSDADLTDPAAVAAYESNRSLILNDTKRNAMAFYVLRNNARPLLLAQPRVLVMNKDAVELDVVNPTIFELEDLTYELSTNLEPYLTVEDKDYVGAYSFRRVTISLDKEVTSDDIGYLRILQSDNEYLKVPIILQSAPRLNITLPERLTIFGSSAVLPFEVRKSSHNFTCGIEWATEGISNPAPFNINSLNGSGTYQFPVRFAVLETENRVYEGEITCTAAKVTFIVPFATNVVRFSTQPLEVRPEFLSFNATSGVETVQVRNLLDERIDVEIGANVRDPYIVLSDTYLTIYPGESQNITVQIAPPEGESYNTSNSIIFRTFNVERRVLVDAMIAPEQRFSLPAWALFAIIGGLVLLGGGGGYYGYTHREKLSAWYTEHFRKESVKEKVFREVREIEREEELTAIRNMMKILKLQGMKDTDVRKRLLDEGYREEDIQEAVKRKEEQAQAKAKQQQQGGQPGGAPQ